jgi:CheY-like chemotaxis protein
VLLVHPQPAVAEAARRHLAAWGAAVTVAASAADAASRSTEWADAALAVAGTSQPADLPGAIETLTAAHSRQRLPIVALIPLSWQPAAPPLAFAWTVTATPIRRARLREAILAALGHDRPSAHHPAPGAPAPGSARALRVLVAEDDPVNQRATAPSARPAHATPSARSQSGLQPATARTVLYIEDDPALRALVQRILARDATVTVLTAADGTTGLQLADTQRPDLILLDWNVPGTSGETLINNLRTGEHTSTIPIVVVSGDTSPATVKHLTGLGAAAHLAKPFDAEHLKAIITAPATRRV